MKIWVDIDDTICYYTNKEENIDYTDYTKAVPDYAKISILNNLYDKGHHITMWTARGTVTGLDWRSLTEKQLKQWGVKYHLLQMGKPAFDLLIDDKALTSLDQVNLQ
jgi:dTDP-glucose 4,6-dehydratase